jgi:hypothetical protein
VVRRLRFRLRQRKNEKAAAPAGQELHPEDSLMLRPRFGCLVFALVSLWLVRVLPAGEPPAGKALIDYTKVDLSKLKCLGAKPSLVGGEKPRLRLVSGHKDPWPGIYFPAPQGTWDLSAYGCVAVEVHNCGTAAVEAGVRVDTPGADRNQCFIDGRVDLRGGETKTLRVRLPPKLPAELMNKLFGMRGYPGGATEKRGFDPANVSTLRLFIAQPTADHVVEFAAIRAEGTALSLTHVDPQRSFPLIDRYGQFKHGDWPGKTHDDEDLAARRREEAADLAGHPGPAGWDQYGGWSGGPKLEASGFFRVEQHAGKWWLVDPEGRLFWSHGIDCVRFETGSTPITDRKDWYEELPASGSPLARFYGKASWAPRGYYQGKKYETYCFSAANLVRKYGAGWQEQLAPLIHRRLRSWGLNSLGNWSAAEVYGLRQTPYVVSLSAGKHKELEGSVGYWGKFADVFDPSFAAGLRQQVSWEKKKLAGDPWCIGYFVDNELSWGDEISLAVAALASPAEQPAKRVFIEDLRRKYRGIENLNRTWGTSHASWDALLASRTPPDKKKARGDLVAFYAKTADKYFQTCRDAVKERAPHNLYLGCRFAWANDVAVRAAAKYCDVVSYNRYQDNVADFRLPAGLDRPVVIGEFHFGALDRGLFHTGLRPVENQRQRAEAYKTYVRSALANPSIVGTHWFEYADQPTTGRGDGENYQIGFVDVCDTPYAETIQASREIGAEMYADRLATPASK